MRLKQIIVRERRFQEIITGLLVLSLLLLCACTGRQDQNVLRNSRNLASEDQPRMETSTEKAESVPPEKESGELTPEEIISHLEVAPTRGDYPSDERYANFRPVEMGNLAPNTLYRCSAPLVGALPGEDRAGFVDDFLREAGVQSVMNMAYTEEELAALLSGEEYSDSYYKMLYDEGKIYTVKMPYSHTLPHLLIP